VKARVELRLREAWMLPTSMSGRRLLSPWSRRFLARSLIAFVVLFATPGAVDVAQEVVSLAMGIERCDELCHEGGGQCCPTTCTQCTCCAHPNAIPAGPVLVPGNALPNGLQLGWCSDGAYTSGYRAPPFRPPAA
jgi:hypothetical protein